LKAKKQKTKTAKGDHAPARRGAGFRRTIQAGAAYPRTRALRPTLPGPARRGERARACELLLLPTLDLRKWRGLPYLSMTTSTSTNKLVLKSSHIPSCSQEWAFKIYWEFHNWLLGQAHINSNREGEEWSKQSSAPPPPSLRPHGLRRCTWMAARTSGEGESAAVAALGFRLSRP
jgi:hypothetical protein